MRKKMVKSDDYFCWFIHIKCTVIDWYFSPFIPLLFPLWSIKTNHSSHLEAIFCPWNVFTPQNLNTTSTCKSLHLSSNQTDVKTLYLPWSAGSAGSSGSAGSALCRALDAVPIIVPLVSTPPFKSASLGGHPDGAQLPRTRQRVPLETSSKHAALINGWRQLRYNSLGALAHGKQQTSKSNNKHENGSIRRVCWWNRFSCGNQTSAHYIPSHCTGAGTNRPGVHRLSSARALGVDYKSNSILHILHKSLNGSNRNQPKANLAELNI